MHINPNGCRYCGVGHNEHGSRWSKAAEEAGHVQTFNAGFGHILESKDGRHTWVQPTQQQILERMLQRRSNKMG